MLKRRHVMLGLILVPSVAARDALAIGDTGTHEVGHVRRPLRNAAPARAQRRAPRRRRVTQAAVPG